MVEKQPYPNVPVYVVHPRDWEGHSWTLYRNYLLPISSNLEQNEKDAPMAGVEHTNTSPPVPSVDNEPTDTEPSGLVTSSTAGNISQGSPDQHAPLRHGYTYNPEQTPVEVLELWFAGRYQSAWDLECMGWSVHLSSFYILSVHCFLGKYGVNTLYLFHPMSAKHHSFWHGREFP